MVIRGDYSSLDSGNITIIEESTIDSGLGEGFTVNVGGAGGTSMKRMVCLPGEGTYSFVIFDSYYNGICCEFGGKSTLCSAYTCSLLLKSNYNPIHFSTTFLTKMDPTR